MGGFLAHTTYLTPDAALQAAIDQGYTKAATGTLDRLAMSDGWRSIYGSEMSVILYPAGFQSDC